ncbi:MAG: iron-containing alcohol dehydrogenase [Roseiflexaceae bacterium]
MIEFFEFQLRPRVLFKAGLVREMENEVGRLGASRALIVADAGVVRTGLLDMVKAGLTGDVQVVGVYSDVPANSSVRAVERGAEYAREVGADLIIAVGGGSPIDTAKCMRILISEGGNLLDYQGYNLLERPLIPMVAIPTTSGTGSEVTPFAVILDEDSHVKMTYASPFLAPDLALLDPEMTRTLPPRLTAATGMDALTHAIETFVSSEANPLSDALALQAIDIISNHLRAATHTGEDMEARGQMLVASCIAGMAFSSGFLGIVHAMAHSVGGAFEVHHGTANAILLPHGMRFNSVVVPNRYARIARALGVNAGGRPEDDVIADGIAAVVALSSDCGLPLRLRDVGVTEESLPGIAETATTDAAIYTNPRHATDEEVLEILRAAW